MKAARTVGPGAAWSFGFKVIDGRTSGGIRRIASLACYTVCPPVTGTEAKAAAPFGLEIKGMDTGMGTASVAHGNQKRWALRCSLCNDYAALSDRPLPPTASLNCADCLDDAGRLTDPFDRMVSEDSEEPLDGDRPERVTAEGAYSEALDDEQEYDQQLDGNLTRATGDHRSRP